MHTRRKTSKAAALISAHVDAHCVLCLWRRRRHFHEPTAENRLQPLLKGERAQSFEIAFDWNEMILPTIA